jgi:hypothetical protein
VAAWSAPLLMTWTCRICWHVLLLLLLAHGLWQVCGIARQATLPTKLVEATLCPLAATCMASNKPCVYTAYTEIFT